MLKHAKLLDGWATVLLVLAWLTILAGVGTGIASNWLAGLLIAGGCLPTFVLSAVCRALALLLEAADEDDDYLQRDDSRDRELEEELRQHAVAELQRLQDDAPPIVSQPQRPRTQAERDDQVAAQLRALHRRRREQG